jgi:hypothetical protein
LIVDSNGISNANASIDSWCLSIICSRWGGGYNGAGYTDIKKTCLSPNSTVDTHDIANASSDEARNDPCDE